MTPLVTITGLDKAFPGVQALKSARFELLPGEVHALMGENGAGKSTLAKIVAGVERPDSGTIEWEGAPVAFKDTRDAVAAGITIVLQELSLIPDLSVAENLFLTQPEAYRGGWWLDRAEIRRRALVLFDRLGWELPVDPDRQVEELTVAEQQMVEIVRALSLDARLFILDEPTAALSPHEVEVLFGLVRRLRARGASFLLVTHRLDEVFSLSDRITVYRDGALSGRFETAATSQGELIRAMVGRDLGDLFAIRHRRPPGEVALRVRGLGRGSQVKNASFEVRRGEIVGVAGLVGAGRTELVRAVFGADKADRGEVEIRGRVGLLGSPAEAIRERAALVPEDRKAQGLLIDQPIDQNVTLAGQAASGGFWLRSGRDRATVRKLIGDLRIKAPFPWQGVSSLSGGNQQKVVLAKWLATEPEVLILDEPTRGIDIGTKFELYGLIDRLAAGGTAVLLVSSELPELLALTDRTLVMRNGGIVAEIPHELASEEAILAAAVGEAGMAGTAAG